jgi:hypothetical protein
VIKVLPADNSTGGDKLVAGAGATPATPPRKGNLKKVETAGGKVKFSKGTKPAAEAAGKAATSVSVTCFVCDQVGHKSYQCPDRVVPAAQSSVNAAVAGNTGTAVPASQPVNATVASIQCKRCDARDHVAEQCPYTYCTFCDTIGHVKKDCATVNKIKNAPRPNNIKSVNATIASDAAQEGDLGNDDANLLKICYIETDRDGQCTTLTSRATGAVDDEFDLRGGL